MKYLLGIFVVVLNYPQNEGVSLDHSKFAFEVYSLITPRAKVFVLITQSLPLMYVSVTSQSVTKHFVKTKCWLWSFVQSAGIANTVEPFLKTTCLSRLPFQGPKSAILTVIHLSIKTTCI